MTPSDAIRPRHVDWSRPALPAVARTLAVEGARDGELDLGPLLLVFPGGRAARRMTELLVAEAEDRGLVLVPPESVTVGALPEKLYRPHRPLASGVLRRRIWARVLREMPPAALEPVAPDPPDEGDLAGWAALARQVQRLHREVAREGLDFADVARVCEGGALGFDDSARWRVLARAQTAYREELDALGRTDRHRARRRALERESVGLYHLYQYKQYRAGEGPEPAIHLVGVPEMPGLLKRMLRRVAAGGTGVVPWIHAPRSRAEAFDELGCVVPEAWAGAAVPVTDEALAFRDGPAEQASEALRAVAEMAPDRAPDEVAVGVPHEGLTPWLEQRFRAHDVPHRVAAGTPLDRTAPYRLLAACADYLGGRRFADLAALLRHPDLDGGLERGGALEAADAYFTERLPARVTDTLVGGDGDSGPPGPVTPAPATSPADRIRRVVGHLEGASLLEPLRGRPRTLSEWMPEILGLLWRIFGQEELDRGDSHQRRIVEACEALRDRAADFHALPADADEDCGAGAAIRLLLAELRGSGDAIPPEPTRSAVELLGWLELHLDDAPDLVLTGANEPHLPESVNADLFLPNRLRSELGLQDNEARFARDAYLLTATLHARERVRVVAGRRDADGNPLRPSRLLLTGDPEDVARRLRRFLEAGEGSGSRPAAPLGLEPADEGSFRTPPEPRIALSDAPERFRVTEFRALLDDPYRWALERHLELGELHDRARELDPLRFGSLAHRVLERFGRTDELHATDPEAVRRRLESVLDRVASGLFDASLPAVPVQVEQLRSRLRAFARWHAEWIAAGWRVAATEAGPDDGVPFEVDGVEVRLLGRIDRIDVHAETGELALFDYKTGDRPADPERAHRSRSGEWRDLQLPLYRHILPHVLDAEGRPVTEEPGAADEEAGVARLRLGYIRLPKDEGKVGPAFLEWDEAVLEEADAEARRLIRRLREIDAIEYDLARTTTNRWDALGPLLGRGVLTRVEDDEEEDGDGRDGESA